MKTLFGIAHIYLLRANYAWPNSLPSAVTLALWITRAGNVVYFRFDTVSCNIPIYQPLRYGLGDGKLALLAG